jgi:hypothetical protein
MWSRCSRSRRNKAGSYELRVDLCCDELAKLLDFWHPFLAFEEVGEGREDIFQGAIDLSGGEMGEMI